MISLRPCTLVDAPAMAALEAKATDFPWSMRLYQDSLAGTHQGYALESNDHLLGHAVIMTVLDEAEILNIVIDPQHQNQGLGTQLLQHVLQQLASNGCQRVFLEVRESNLAARTLYKKQGFSDSGLRKNYYPTASGREHAILMEVTL
jgi:ribosomal-protein-alanine N-acetyltransferase